MTSNEDQRALTTLTANSEEALQRLVNCFACAFKEFYLSVSLKRTNRLGQDVSSISCISIGDFTLEVVEDFIYLSSTSNLPLDAEINTSESAKQQQHWLSWKRGCGTTPC